MLQIVYHKILYIIHSHVLYTPQSLGTNSEKNPQVLYTVYYMQPKMLKFTSLKGFFSECKVHVKVLKI